MDVSLSSTLKLRSSLWSLSDVFSIGVKVWLNVTDNVDAIHMQIVLVNVSVSFLVYLSGFSVVCLLKIWPSQGINMNNHSAVTESQLCSQRDWKPARIARWFLSIVTWQLGTIKIIIHQKEISGISSFFAEWIVSIVTFWRKVISKGLFSYTWLRKIRNWFKTFINCKGQQSFLLYCSFCCLNCQGFDFSATTFLDKLNIIFKLCLKLLAQ